MTATTDTPAVPDYAVEPEDYLLHHKWKPLGPVASPLTRWIDPTKPWPRGEYGKTIPMPPNAKGEPEPVMRRDLQGHVMVVEQTVWAPPAEPMTLQAAVECQIERDIQANILATDEREQQRHREEQEARAKALRKLEALAAAGALDKLPVSYSGVMAGGPASGG